MAGAHHERLDGKGYPRGLAGEAICLETRIITIADIFDALTADRPYRAAMPVPRRSRSSSGTLGRRSTRIVSRRSSVALRGLPRRGRLTAILND